MENIEKLDEDNGLEKKEWKAPIVDVIAFFLTKGGLNPDNYEDAFVNDDLYL